MISDLRFGGYDSIAFGNLLMDAKLIQHVTGVERRFEGDDSLYFFDEERLQGVIVEWSCSSCTFKNLSDATQCSMCGKDKSLTESPSLPLQKLKLQLTQSKEQAVARRGVMCALDELSLSGALGTASKILKAYDEDLKIPADSCISSNEMMNRKKNGEKLCNQILAEANKDKKTFMSPASWDVFLDSILQNCSDQSYKVQSQILDELKLITTNALSKEVHLRRFNLSKIQHKPLRKRYGQFLQALGFKLAIKDPDEAVVGVAVHVIDTKMEQLLMYAKLHDLWHQKLLPSWMNTRSSSDRAASWRVFGTSISCVITHRIIACSKSCTSAPQ